jgi:hypothetical protein
MSAPESNWMHIAKTKPRPCVGHNEYYRCGCDPHVAIITQGRVYFQNTRRGPFCESCARYLGMFHEGQWLPKTGAELTHWRWEIEAAYQAHRKAAASAALADVKRRELRSLNRFQTDNQ